MTSAEIIAAEVGPHKAATILAALRAAGWEVERNPCRQPPGRIANSISIGNGDPPPPNHRAHQRKAPQEGIENE